MIDFLISLETQQPIANRYVIASHISNDAAVSYHSAFEFYGYSNQVFYETQVTSESRFRDFEYDGVTYRRIAPRITGGITEINGIRVTTLERTVIDSINLFEKIGGLEELLRCLALIPTLDEAALSACLAEYESGFLYSWKKASSWSRQSALQNQPKGGRSRTKSACLTKWCWVSRTTTGLLPVSAWTAGESTAES